MVSERKSRVGAVLLVAAGLLLFGSCDEDLDLPALTEPSANIVFVAEPTVGDAPLTVTFTGIVAAANAGDVQYQLDFGDGSDISEDPNVSHVYTGETLYTATLVAVWDSARAVGIASVDIDTCKLPEGGVSFEDDVNPLFSTSGCTACHNSTSNEGNLDLSGSADFNYSELTEDLSGAGGTARVIEGEHCEPGECESKILTFASETLDTSHTGGTDWPAGSCQYLTVQLWIEEGANRTPGP